MIEVGLPARLGVGRVLVVSPVFGIVDYRVRALDRLLARVRARGLDRELGRGEPPESTVLLALRAVRLVGCASRRDLAGTVRRVIELANRPGWASYVDVLVCVRNVRAALDEMHGLLDRLEGPGPVSAHGIARLRVLLSDDGGPLYQSASRDDLGAQLRDVCTALDTLLPPGR